MLSRHLNQQPQASDRDAAGGSAGDAQAPLLDPQALQRLRELDPSGANKLLARIVDAFASSVARLVPQLHAARAAADADGIRHVAHTLKSSSASLGAVKLSRMCADMEALARQDRTDGMHDRIADLTTEIDAVLAALKKLPHSPP